MNHTFAKDRCLTSAQSPQELIGSRRQMHTRQTSDYEADQSSAEEELRIKASLLNFAPCQHYPSRRSHAKVAI